MMITVSKLILQFASMGHDLSPQMCNDRLGAPFVSFWLAIVKLPIVRFFLIKKN